MPQVFLMDIAPQSNAPRSGSGEDRPSNKMVLIGDPEWVKGQIYRLHAAGIVDQSLWSRLLPTQNPGEVIATYLQRRGR
ncbi:MAG: hypothetical protein HC769_13805 [Cyanobacteria bacterium CRU_2_1]|nr:hypothetical protein [Cyanobacteria bacterium RU_5_0]NJR59813.1 hypothetical protein [Cyanobacteria bacterium CRU_2_1]